MSKFDVQLHSDLDLKIIKVKEPCTFGEINMFLTTEFSKTRTQNMIWDIAPGSLQLLDVDDIKGLRATRISATGPRPNGHTVFVGYDPAEQLLLKWNKEYEDGLPDRTVEYHLADTLDAAIEIIKVNYKAG